MGPAHQPSAGSGATARPATQVKVDDMTCGHCAGTIRRAIESSVPGAKVATDLSARVVSVEGADYATISGIIADEGFTPAPPHA